MGLANSAGRGKVFVFSGILRTCQDEDGLAAVLSHEIAHSVAHHTAERLSQAAILIPLAFLLAVTFQVSDQLVRAALQIAWELPGSRKHEVTTHSWHI